MPRDSSPLYVHFHATQDCESRSSDLLPFTTTTHTRVIPKLRARQQIVVAISFLLNRHTTRSHIPRHHGQGSPVQALHGSEVCLDPFNLTIQSLTCFLVGLALQDCVSVSPSSNNRTTANPSSHPSSSPFPKVHRAPSSSLVVMEDFGTRKLFSLLQRSVLRMA